MAPATPLIRSCEVLGSSTRCSVAVIGLSAASRSRISGVRSFERWSTSSIRVGAVLTAMVLTGPVLAARLAASSWSGRPGFFLRVPPLTAIP